MALSKKKTLITFYTDGSPCYDLTNEKERIQRISRRIFDDFIAFTPQKVKEMGGEQYIQQHNHELQFNKHHNLLGYCAWKPFIILKTLENLQDGDIVVYTDVNVSKYPHYLGFLSTIDKHIEKWFRDYDCDFIIFGESLYKKMYMFSRKITMMEICGKINYDFPSVCANLILFRKSEQSIKIATDWLQLCTNMEYMVETNEDHSDPGFEHLCPEQSVLNALVCHYEDTGYLPKGYPFYYTDDRLMYRKIIDDKHSRIGESKSFVMSQKYAKKIKTSFLDLHHVLIGPPQGKDVSEKVKKKNIDEEYIDTTTE